MPFYEYVCSDCGAQTEKLQKLSDPALTECPACHHQSLVKVVSAAGFRLKGGGWYETDFKSANKKNLSAGDSDSASAPKSGAATGGEGGSKPAATPAAAAPSAAPSPAPASAPAKPSSSGS